MLLNLIGHQVHACLERALLLHRWEALNRCGEKLTICIVKIKYSTYT